MNRSGAAKFREAVLERDDYTCVDCGNQFPESMLEADHDDELSDGGPNDPAAGVTRCLDDHDRKTQEKRMARTDTATKPTRNQRAAATAQLPDKPGFPGRPLVATFLLALSATGLTHLLAPDYMHAPLIAWGLFAALGVGVYAVRQLHWHRLVEAQRIYERLCKVTGTARAARSQRFKVNTWAGTDARAVTIQPGPDFEPDDPRAMGALVEAFARTVRVPVPQVRGEVVRGGRVRLTVRAPDESRVETARPGQEAARDEHADTVVRDMVATRVRAALGDVLDAPCQVEVTEWHGDNSPAAGVLTYDAAATKAARDSRAELPVVMGDAFTPHNGRWQFTWDSAHDRFLFADSPDALASLVPLPPVEDDLDLAAGPIIGRHENGDPWRVPLLHNHVLVAGATGAGKGSVLWGLIRGVMPMIRDGRVKLWVIDPKGGMELGVLEPIAHRFSLAGDAAEVLEEAAAVMEAQARRLTQAGVRKLEHPTVDTPLHIIVVDELAAITSLAPDARTRNEIFAYLGRLLTQGRAVGACVVSALQEPSKEVLKQRSLFPGRIALRLDERTQADMVLGAGARAGGAVCDTIPRALPGVGHVATDGKAGYPRVRAAFVPDDEIARLVEQQTRTAPAHRTRALGEQLAFEESARGGDPVPVGEVLASANTPAAEPIPMRALEGGEHVLLPADSDPVRVVCAEPDEDCPEDRVLLTYVYDGETGEREASFERSDLVTPI